MPNGFRGRKAILWRKRWEINVGVAHVRTMFLKCLGDTSSSQKQYPTVIQELCHQFSLVDIRKLTNNFHQNRLIGYGGFSKVYKGCLQHNDASDYTVAVKQFFVEYSEQLFKSEIELLCQLHHPNCVSLIGFCNHKNKKIIVYEYMSNGSLDRHLRGEDTEALSWNERLEICIGAARGLHYLHAGAKRTIIHRDICVANILLNDDMEPKLTGFGHSIQGASFMSKPKPVKVNHYWGTSGYMAREYFKDHAVTDKYDVHSFGVVLLQVVCGRNHLIMPTERLENVFEENIDVNIKEKIAPECWQVFIDITQRCLLYEADERPTMGEVEVELEHALSLQEQADISNTDGHYTLFSTTITHQGQHGAELETITDDSDTEEM